MKHVILMTLGAALLAAPVAQASEDKVTLQAIGMGRAHYLVNCSRCHGGDARGRELGEGHNGEVVPIPDLTAITLRDGKFAPIHVAQHIDGRAWGACTSGMPCWQQIEP